MKLWRFLHGAGPGARRLPRALRFCSAVRARRGGRRPVGAAGLVAVPLLALLVAPVAAGPGIAAASPAAAQAQVLREQAAIAAVDAQLVKAQAERAALQAAQAAGTRRLAALAGQGRDLSAELAGGRQRTDAVVRFLYEDGTLSLLDFLLSSTSFADLVTRFTFLQRLVAGQIDFLRQVAAERRKLSQVTSAARAQQARLQAQARQLQALLGRLGTLLAQHQATLANASASLATLDRTLLDVLPKLETLLGSFGSLPWSGINPDNIQVDYATQEVTATIRAATIDAFFAANAPQFAGFAFGFDAGGIVLSGNGVRLAGPLRLTGGQLVWSPDDLQVAGQAAPPGTLAQLLTGRPLAVTLPVPGGLHPVTATTSPGRLQIVLAP